MLLSVIINTFGRPASLDACLAAVAAQHDADPFEIIIIDDGGTADLAPVFHRWEPRLPLRLERIEHKGPGGARNRGVALARGPRVMFLGDDVMVRPGCLARHKRVEDPWVAVLGPYPWETITGSPPFRHWAEPNPQWEIEDDQNAGFKYFCTGNISMSREAFNELGGFDERYDRYGWEDIDLGLAFEIAGGRIIFDRAACAVHDHPRSDRASLWRRERAMGHTAFLFWQKWSHAAPGVASPDVAEFMRFWDDPAEIKPPSEWRRHMGEKMTALLDKIAPSSPLNWTLYERLVFSYRLEGVAAAWRMASRAGSAPAATGLDLS